VGFVLAHEAVDTAIVDTSDPEHMKANIRMAAQQLPLSGEAVQELQGRFDALGSSWSQET
jgi:aryl-alcohol dehydrogenase-like predicted oxidoreductase